MSVSCRQQIEHFCERPAYHLAHTLREAVADEPATGTENPPDVGQAAKSS